METFGDRRAFLMEMFPSLSSKEVEQVLIKNPQRSLSDIVNLLLDAEELHRKEDGRETKAPADEEAYEMISLMPARTGSDEELTSGAEKDAEKQHQHRKEEQEDLIVLSDDDEEEKQTTTQQEEQDFESSMLNTLHELFSQLETEVRHVQLQLQHSHVAKSISGNTSDVVPSVVLTLTTLLRLVDNVLQHPDEDKYRTVNLKNATVRARIGQFPAAIRILEEANFKLSPVDDCLILESIDEQRLSLVRSWLLCFVDLPPPPVTPSPTAQSVPVPSAPPAPVRSTAPPLALNHERVLQPIQFRPDYRLPPREVLARLHEQRLTAKRKRPTTPLTVEPSNENVNPYYKGYVTRGGLPTNRNADFHKQLREYRSTQRSHEWQNTRQGRKRMYTIADLEAEDRARKYEAGWAPGAPPGTTGPGTNRTAVHTIENTFMDPQRIGLKALELTNKFRASQGRPPLIWNQALCQIGIEHSRRMAEGVVPFGHDGFNQRVASFPFPVRSAAENVAMNQGLGAVAEVAVQGWIESPGHRKNLLGDFEVCGIGVYRSWNGSFYLTQLFAY
eukprot:GILK01012847.1.p1 GENE.GILK01012847.1~~GILK01012847.1.p1  ORF type:complete len:559 (-),score=114.46 GILK01012847.1:108-1784(-)